MAAKAPLGLCPKCLLKTGLGSGPDEQQKTEVAPGVPTAGILHPGEQFGHYRILGILGGGGMGSVFEADDLETGRRVALKVLGQALDAPDARERFFREGRLAASINHPNSVYIFGTEEVGGTPVIAMELVAGGTLEEFVQTHGPMSTGDAVDAVLQIIAGLEAAQKVGILHRDIKPSNCFRALDGTVKIGDFGLSISTAIRTEPALTATGAFLGTPAFCSPEQLRGEELNARSDMYSVGATLFYLLTGRTPFEAKNAVALIATVLEHPAPSPRQIRPGIPEGLARIVRRCLEKQSGERFKTYGELRQALAPHGSAAPVPGRLALRFAAGLLDLLILNACIITILSLFSLDPLSCLSLFMSNPARSFAIFGSLMLGSVLYYTVLEGLWGATLGKRICRLLVVGPHRSMPGIPRALGRALIYVLAPTLPTCAVYAGTKNFLLTSDLWQALVGFSVYVIFGLLFVTARRRNGLAAVQDLATGTRVISRLDLEARSTLAAVEAPPRGIDKLPLVGPYHVLDTLSESPRESWLLGYDLRLLRKVWIHLVPAGTLPVAAAIRHLSRMGRQRWLTGLRSPSANWDAFEALDGKPLPAIGALPQPWAQVRYWLFDLAEELAAAEKDGTLPVLGPDRVWITNEGRAKLLDFAAPGPKSGPAAAATPEQESKAPPVLPSLPPGPHFLNQVAVLALEGRSATNTGETRRATLLPLEARKLIINLPGQPNIAAVRAALKPLLHRPPIVTRARRACVVAACAGLPLFVFVASLFGIRMMQQWNQQNPGMMQLSQLLQQRAALRLWGQAGRGPGDEKLGIYIARHYRAVITNEASWNSFFSVMMIKGDSRRFAEKSLSDYPAPTAQQMTEADAAVAPMVRSVEFFDLLKKPWFLVSLVYGTFAIYVAIPAFLAAILFRGGLVVRAAGVAFVRKDGEPASRLRLGWRALVAWSPVGVALVLVPLLARETLAVAAFGPAVLMGLLATLDVLLPERGLPDRVAGTWPVPR
ncbi:MAG TPA: protein kinase [Verrucomicrobiae bacterium]